MDDHTPSPNVPLRTLFAASRRTVGQRRFATLARFAHAAYTVLFLSVAHVDISYAVDKLRAYRDAEFGFVFSYPTSWSEKPGLGRNTRVVITAPASQRTAEANCNVAVRPAPSTLNQTQDQLNRGLDGKEFEKEYWLRDMPQNTRVFESRKISLGSHAARTVVLDYSATVQGYTGYATQLHLITLSPGLLFHLVCGSQGNTPEEGRTGFTYWKATFSRIAQSLRLSEKK